MLGDAELQKKLNNLTNTLGKQVVSTAMGKAMRQKMRPLVKAQIAKVSPGDTPHINQGNLRRLPLQVYRRKNKGGKRPSRFAWHVATPTREKLKIKPKQAYYPLTLEKGGHPGGGKMEPKFMLRRARNQGVGTVKTLLRKLIGEGIEKKVRKLGKQKAFR
jgi:hypothetical protein